jgi:FkbM family methyltransferase
MGRMRLAHASLDDLVGRWSEDARARDVLVPLVRAYIRYCPLRSGKPFVWTRIVEPYLAWYPRAFRARTLFGFSLDGNSQDLIQQWIYYFGIWEPALTTWIRRRLGRGDTFVDVGANIGYYALLGSRTVGPPGRVVAIEASPTIAESLARNIGSNRAENVRTIHAAALGERSVVRLYRGGDSNSGETTIVEAFARGFECEVQAFPLHELLTDDELRTARLFKIDVEGAEYQVMAGLDSLDKLRPDAELIIEVHPGYLAERGETLDALLALMTSAGYAIYEVKEEWWAPAYLAGAPVPAPRRFTGQASDGTVLIFSRVHADALE